MSYQWNWSIFSSPVPTGDTTYLGWLLEGLQITLALSLSAWVIALLLGSLMGVLRTVPHKGLSRFAGREVGLTFVPHLTPIIRGIHATLYAQITGDADFQSLYEDHYAGEPFVDVMPPKSHPETRSVRAANVCRIAVHRPQGGKTLVVLSVIDNLVKGAAGQAVQNMNLMFGRAETEGLWQVPVLP